MLRSRPSVWLPAVVLALTACTRQPVEEAPFPNCPGSFKASGEAGIKAVLPTDSGMHGLWDPSAFGQVCTFKQWEKLFVENPAIERSIAAGSFVPIYVHSDGAPMFEVRVGSANAPSTISDKELPMVRQKSQSYLFVSHGLLSLSGIEYIHGFQDAHAISTIELPQGRWVAQVVELEAPQDANGKPTSDVPDLLILLNPEGQTPAAYRRSVETFQ